MSVKVKNKKGTGNNNAPSGYSSWKDFWEKKTGKKFGICGAINCSSSAEHGGHVYDVSKTAKEYIIPLCADCNNPNNTDEYEVVENWLQEVNEK